MSVWKLRLAMILLAIATFLIGSAILYGTLMLLGIPLTWRLFIMLDAILCFFIALGQWLFAPYIIELIYNCVEADPVRYRKLYEIVKELAVKSGLKQIPKVMIAYIPIPNAFAYGSPLTGPRVAVTKPLLDMLDENELKAVLGHEIGHLRHRDVAWMLALGLIPMIVWSIGETMFRLGFFTSIFAPSSSREDYTPAIWALIGILLIAIAFLLNIFVLAFSRYREYYADRHSVSLVPNGGKYLQRALAKIILATKYGMTPEVERKLVSLMQLKALFIQDPVAEMNVARFARNIDEFIEYLKNRKLTLYDKIKELFSTHPDITRRLRMLDKFNEEFWSMSAVGFREVKIE